MCSSAGSTPAVADMRTRLAHGRLAELHPKRVIALAVGEPIRVPYLKLYDDGYYRPRSPTGRGQCHTDSGFGRAVWRCPLTFDLVQLNEFGQPVANLWTVESAEPGHHARACAATNNELPIGDSAAKPANSAWAGFSSR